MTARALIALVAIELSSMATAGASEGGEVSLFAGDVGTAIWTLVIFGLVIVVLGKFAWGPLLETLQTREDFIRSALEEAKREREESEARLREYNAKLNEARAEATAIVDEGRRDADVVKQRIEGEAAEEAKKTVERAKREIEIATQTAVKHLYETSSHLATEIAGGVLQREIQAKDHQRLISESIRKLEGLEEN